MIKIICEAGCNWRTLDEAFQFIDESKRLGLFATKFQLFEEKQIQEADPNIQDFLRTIQLTFNDARDLWNYGQDIGQEVFFSVMFPEAVDWCEKIGCNHVKIREKDQMNTELLHAINKEQFEKRFISSDFDNDYFREILDPNYIYIDKIIPLYCVSKYPAKLIDYLFFDLDRWGGISDHTFDLHLLKYVLEHVLENNWRDWYFEKHVMLDSFTDALEKDWSVRMSQLEEVLNK